MEEIEPRVCFLRSANYRKNKREKTKIEWLSEQSSYMSDHSDGHILSFYLIYSHTHARAHTHTHARAQSVLL